MAAGRVSRAQFEISLLRARVSYASFEVNASAYQATTDSGTGTDSGLRIIAGAQLSVTDSAVGTDVSNVSVGGTQSRSSSDYGFGFQRTAAAGLVFLYRDGEKPAVITTEPADIVRPESGVGFDFVSAIVQDLLKAGTETGVGDDTSSLFVSPPLVEVEVEPTPLIDFSWATNPLDPAPIWEAADEFLRSVNTRRGRSYEFDRMEAGQATYLLSNRDERFDPNNVDSPYYPQVIPTRRVRVRAEFRDTIYPVIQAFTDGFPQEFPGVGFDSIVRQEASDWFYPLNTLKFQGGTTTLLATIGSATQTTISLDSIDLPMPQAYPFVIQVGASPDTELMTVTGSPGPNLWTVERGYNDTVSRTFLAGTPVLSQEVRFAVEQSGSRIQNCLNFLGVALPDRDIDTGNTLIAASDNLVGTSILEHILLIAECENGRFFVTRNGTVTFRERHWQFLQELAPRAAFGTGGEIPYLGEGVVLAHDDAKLFNHVKITIADGTVVEALDQASIDDHMERTLEKQWPLESAVEARDAAIWMLTRLRQPSLRLPAVSVALNGEHVPLVLAAELAQRFHLVVDPPVADAAVIESDVIVEQVSHTVTPGSWRATFEFSEPDPVKYWRVEVPGASELDDTTVLAY